MPAVPFAKTGTAPEDTAWSWDSATQNALLGSDGSDWAQYKAAHAWWDGSVGDDAQKKAPYKLPHHQLSGGSLEAVWHGVTNAMARLSQTKMPDSDMKDVFDHLAKHYTQWDKDPPEWNRFLQQAHIRQGGRTLALPLNTTRAMILASRPKGVPLDSDMPLIQRQMRSPIQDPQRLYAFPAAISDRQVDSYYTRMSPVSLSNFASDATAGVSICDSHNHNQMPMGRSFYGEVGNAPDGGMQCQSLAYLIRGMRLPGGMTSDDYITALEGGIYHDVSIGFDPERYWCSICGRDMLSDMDCDHWPGNQYELDGGIQQCVADVDSHLVEYSPVYKGANPGAAVMPNGSSDTADDGRAFTNVMVLKATAEIERGRASRRNLMFVEDACRVRLFNRFSGYSLRTEEDTAVPLRQTAKPMTGAEFVAGLIRRIELKAERAGKAVSADNLAALQGLHTKMQAGHGTMADAMRELADFITANGGITADPDSDGDMDIGTQGDTDDTDNDIPTDVMDPMAADSGAYGVGSSTDQNGAPSVEMSVTEYDPSADPQPIGSSATGTANNTSSGPNMGAKGGQLAAATTQTREVAAPPVVKDRLTAEERDMLTLATRMRDEAIDSALQMGARALGTNFNPERYRTILARASFDEIRAMTNDWEEIARRTFSPIGAQRRNGSWTTEPTMQGGRQTRPNDPNDPIGLKKGEATQPTKAPKVNPNQYKA